MLGYGWPRTMLTYTAVAPLGPYTRATRNANSLNGSCYFSRFLRGPRMEILITHQTWTYRGTHTSYISPYKLAHLDDDGTFSAAVVQGQRRPQERATVDGTGPRRQFLLCGRGRRLFGLGRGGCLHQACGLRSGGGVARLPD